MTGEHTQPLVDLSVVLVIRRDAVLALRCLPAVVAAVPSDVEADLLVLAFGLDEAGARPLDALEGAVRVVRADGKTGLGAALIGHLPSGRRIVVVDADATAPLGADDGSALTAAVEQARRDGSRAARDADVSGFDRTELVRSGEVFAYALDVPSLTAISALVAVPPAGLVDEPVVRRALPAPAGIAQLIAPTIAVVTMAPVGVAAADIRAVLNRRRAHTRDTYVDVIACPAPTVASLAQLMPTARVVAASDGVGGWNAALAIASEFDLVAVLPFASRPGRFWLEGLRAACTPGVAAVLPRDARSVPAVLPGERFSDLAERVRRSAPADARPLAAPTGAALLVRGALLRAALLDTRFLAVAAAWQDLAGCWAAAGWQLVAAEGVLVDDARDDTAEYAGLWRTADPSPDQARLVRTHGVRVLPDAVAAAMIVKNEQATLPRALASLAGVVDEVLIADTGSTDDTVALALALGAKVIHVAWTDDFAAARNAGLDQVDSAWTLIFDADEEAELIDAAGLRQTLRRSSVSAFMVDTRHLTGGVHNIDGAITSPAMRLFRSVEHRYKGRIHEQVIRLDGGDFPHVIIPALRLVHRGYLAETVASKDKTRRNSEIARARFEQEGTWMAAFECGRALMLTHDELEAEPFLRSAAEQIPITHTVASVLFRLLAQAADVNGRPDVLDLARHAVKIRPSDVDSVLVCASMLIRHGSPAEAIATIDAYALAGVDQLWTNSTGAEVVLPSLRGEALAAAGRNAEAVEELRGVAMRHPEAFLGWQLLATLLATGVDSPGADTWARELARLASPAPGQLLRQVGAFDVSDRAAVLEALRAEGVDLTSLLAHERDSAGAVHGDDRDDGVIERARRAELTRPDAALELWRSTPQSAERSAGEARCLVALGESRAAYVAVREVDPACLTHEDRLLAAALAVECGAGRHAVELLDAAPLPASFRSDELALRAAASASAQPPR